MVKVNIKEWERLRKDIPAVENSIDQSMAKCHSLDDCVEHKDLDWGDKEDVVNSPSHYASGGIECIDAIQDSMSEIAFKGYLKGNIQKYLWRYEMKGKPVEDLKKAQWYLNRLIESVEFHNG
tara:strand:- start:1327 stop:1692 length:366 start_codon:yes stop_codon:yes gene_type:complete